MRLTWLADDARAAGLRVTEVSNWQTRGYDFGRYRPKLSASYGVVIAHHTAESRHSGNAGGLGVVVHGRPGLDGPIANYYLARDGLVYVVAAGVANNAGAGNARAAGHSGWDGNSSTISIEAANDGRGEPWSPEQMDAYARLSAVICGRMGWPASRVLGHKEWSTSGKPDPSFDMPAFRARVARALAHQEDDEMPLRTSLGKSQPQPLPWGRFSYITWDQEHSDRSDAHADGDYPSYIPDVASWVDAQAHLRVDGLEPGDEYQVRYEVHTYRGGESVATWSEIEVDDVATRGNQYLSATISKHLHAKQRLRVAVAVFRGDDDPESRPEPVAVSGRWTVRQDRA